MSPPRLVEFSTYFFLWNPSLSDLMIVVFMFLKFHLKLVTKIVTISRGWGGVGVEERPPCHSIWLFFDRIHWLYLIHSVSLGGGDNWLKLELSFALLPRHAHGIYKHILFYWCPTFFAKKNPLAKKLILTNFPQFSPENIHSESFILFFSHSRSILEQNVWKQTPHNRGLVWEGGLFSDILS